jgi:hypothetical protein
VKPISLLLILTGAITLAGCKPQAAALDQARPGRYAGVGLYAPSEAWKRIVDTALPKGAAKAGLVDDEQVIVVVDSDTGEVRQCGALSGYCVGVKPWGHAVSQTLPVNLAPRR